jgi:superfamily II DNA or RNA helicase
MDAFPTVNSFLARFFVNRGQCDNRWELKAHARNPFYRALSHWAIFLTNPAVYGWNDQTEPLPPIEVHMHHVGMTSEQQTLAYEKTGRLFVDQIGGITNRSVLSQIAKGNYRGREISTNKPGFIRNLIESWPDESTIVWCLYNAEQDRLEKELDGAESIAGDTPYEHRERIIGDFKAGRCKTLITKPKILGFGLNLQVATRQVFSGLQDSYESYYQAVKRSNRYGAIHPLNVHIPFTDIEHPMIETVMRKARDVQQDTEEQERIFHAAVLER